MRRLVLLLALWLASVPVARADTPPPPPPPAQVQEIVPDGLSARVEPQKVRIGEPFLYEVVITHPKDHRYELTAPKDAGDFELLDQTRQRKDGAESAVTSFGVRMSSFALGAQQVPTLVFDVATPEGPRRFTLTGKQVEVASTLPPDADGQGAEFYDYQPPMEVPIRSWRLVLALLAALAVGGLTWALLRWWKNRPTHVVVEPPKPLDVRTRLALDTLKAEDLPAKGRAQDFYFRLSEILRGYLGERYEFEALECTSTELMTMLRRKSTPGLPEDGLLRFVSESDMVKYARADASPEACRNALAFGYELLAKTYAPPPPPTPAANDAAAPRVQ